MKIQVLIFNRVQVPINDTKNIASCLFYWLIVVALHRLSGKYPMRVLTSPKFKHLQVLTLSAHLKLLPNG